jgi:hypothetical protein
MQLSLKSQSNKAWTYGRTRRGIAKVKVHFESLGALCKECLELGRVNLMLFYSRLFAEVLLVEDALRMFPTLSIFLRRLGLGRLCGLKKKTRRREGESLRNESHL